MGKILEFPEERSNIEKLISERFDSKISKEEEEDVEEGYFVCKACGFKDNKGILALNMGGIPVLICTNCRTLQLPKEAYEELKRKLSSNIITL